MVVDQNWLDAIASTYGPLAPTGILAHEWGHLVQGLTPKGINTELQADCLAGVHLKWAGLSESDLSQFERANFYNGDPPGVAVPDPHGTGLQRVAAVRRGYFNFDRSRTYTRQEIVSQACPYSAVY